MKRNKLGVADIILIVFLAITAFVALYPFWNILMISLNEPGDTLRGGITVWFRDFTLSNYQHIFSQDQFITALTNSVTRTVVGTVTHLLICSAFAYALSKPYLIGQKVMHRMLVVSMYITAGTIPTFLVYKALGLYKSFWVYILPHVVSAYHAIIMMSFFRDIPNELEESARLDGANDISIFLRIIMPVSKPVLASIGLFIAVWQWNSWFDTMIYGSKEMITLQMMLVNIIRDASEVRNLMSSGSPIAAALAALGHNPNVESVKATAMMVTAIPIVCVYPFVQKHFVKGIMIGSVKG